MKNLFLAGLGGGIGSMFRYGLAVWLQGLSKSTGFPWGTAFANILGCFLIGALSKIADSRQVFSESTGLLMFVGFLGGFTTFSAFAGETMNFVRENQMAFAAANVFGQVFLGLFGVWLGRNVSGIFL